MPEIIGLAASAAGGGVFGLVGTALGRIAGMFERRQTLAHERARWLHEADLARLQQAPARDESEAQRVLADLSGRWDGLRASLASEAQIGASYTWVNAVRGLTRPALTLMLWLITAFVWIGADSEGRSAIVETATFAATAATLWWFGDRGPRRDI